MVQFDCKEPAEIRHVNRDQEALKKHFTLFYKMLAKRFDTQFGISRCFSGINMAYNNMVLGVPHGDWDSIIKEQIRYFAAHNVPFVWYVDQDASPQFKQKLQEHGFKDQGILKGVMGQLNGPIVAPPLASGCVIEEAASDKALDEFMELVGATFMLDAEAQGQYKEVLQNPKCKNYVLRKNGVVVSTITTVTDGTMISFWNGATQKDERRQGFSYALRAYALNQRPAHATVGASYLMAEGMAFGICQKLGYKPTWQFHAFTLG